MKSMTGYGAHEGRVDKGVLFAEVRSVNHRYCDVMVRMPNKMNVLEPKIKALVKQVFSRGKVEVFIKEKMEIPTDYTIHVDKPLAKKYQQAIGQLKKTLDSDDDIDVLDIVDISELVRVRAKDIKYDRYWNRIKPIVLGAIKKCEVMRKREGSHLKKDQLMIIARLSKSIQGIQKHTKKAVANYRQQLRKKMRPNLPMTNDVAERLEAEVSFQAEKMDIAEEITRMMSHIKQYRHISKKPHAIGKELDFLLQEMHREVNTIGSKSNDMDISKLVIQAKGDVEKLREQVQNIE